MLDKNSEEWHIANKLWNELTVIGSRTEVDCYFISDLINNLNKYMQWGKRNRRHYKAENTSVKFKYEITYEKNVVLTGIKKINKNYSDSISEMKEFIKETRFSYDFISGSIGMNVNTFKSKLSGNNFTDKDKKDLAKFWGTVSEKIIKMFPAAEIKPKERRKRGAVKEFDSDKEFEQKIEEKMKKKQDNSDKNEDIENKKPFNLDEE